MARKVAGDRNLDFEGKKQAVRNAIDIYEKEIAGGKPRPISTPSSMRRWQGAALVDEGKSALARATLRRRPRTCVARRKSAANDTLPE